MVTRGLETERDYSQLLGAMNELLAVLGDDGDEEAALRAPSKPRRAASAPAGAPDAARNRHLRRLIQVSGRRPLTVAACERGARRGGERPRRPPLRGGRDTCGTFLSRRPRSRPHAVSRRFLESGAGEDYARTTSHGWRGTPRRRPRFGVYFTRAPGTAAERADGGRRAPRSAPRSSASRPTSRRCGALSTRLLPRSTPRTPSRS